MNVNISGNTEEAASSSRSLLKNYISLQCVFSQLNDNNVQNDFCNGLICKENESVSFREIDLVRNILQPRWDGLPYVRDAKCEVAAAHFLALMDQQDTPFFLDEMYAEKSRTYKEWFIILQNVSNSSYWKTCQSKRAHTFKNQKNSMDKPTNDNSQYSDGRSLSGSNGIISSSINNSLLNNTASGVNDNSLKNINDEDNMLDCNVYVKSEYLPEESPDDLLFLNGHETEHLSSDSSRATSHAYNKKRRITSANDETIHQFHYNESSLYDVLLVNSEGLKQIQHAVYDVKEQIVRLRSEASNQDRCISTKLNMLLHGISSSNISSDAMIPTQVLQGPADTLEELDALLQCSELSQCLLHIVGRSVVETCRKLIRRLLTRNLACQFSLTGLGDKRAHTKLSFKDHPISKVVVDSASLHHPDATRHDIMDCCRKVFRGAPDWDGGRSLRKKLKEQQGKDPLNTQDNDVAVSNQFCEDVAQQLFSDSRDDISASSSVNSIKCSSQHEGMFDMQQ